MVSILAVARVVFHGDAVRMTEVVVITTAAEHGCAHLAEGGFETRWDTSSRCR